MRRVMLLAVPLLAAGCGGSGSDYRNRTRPPAPITISAAIHANRVELAPTSLGAGPVVVIASNQSGRTQQLTLETADVTRRAGIKESSRDIVPLGTGRLQANVRPGTYTLHTRDRAVRPVSISVGPRRPSSQNDLLLP